MFFTSKWKNQKASMHLFVVPLFYIKGEHLVDLTTHLSSSFAQCTTLTASLQHGTTHLHNGYL